MTDSWDAHTPPVPWPDGCVGAACFTFDLDEISGILHTNPEAARCLDVIAQQSYGIRTGLPRILDMLARHEVRATFFVPGYTAERWPDVIRAIDAAGHEIAHHGYQHEYVHGMSLEDERKVLLRGLDAIETVTGRRPVGYRAPGFRMNVWTPELLQDAGFAYDSSLQDSDWPYLLATADTEREIVELPVSWVLDDWAYYMHLPAVRPPSPIAEPESVYRTWLGELRAAAGCHGLAMLTIHPFLSGRAARVALLDRLIGIASGELGMWVTSAGEIARHAAQQRIEVVSHRIPHSP